MSSNVQMPNVEFRPRIARVFRSARKTLGCSQAKFAKELGLKQSALSKIETNALSISVDTLFRFCDLTGISADQVSRGTIETIEKASLKDAENLGLYKIPKKYT